MKIRFTKMHGLGNDFVLIDCREQPFPLTEGEVGDISRRLCDRRYGIGADQVLLLCPSENADFRMRIFNADGSEVEMCGNGIRCLARYVWDKNLSDKSPLEIETLAGIIRPERVDDGVRVDMGRPVFSPAKIPVDLPPDVDTRRSSSVRLAPPFQREDFADGVVFDYPLRIADREFLITCVSMGNPHAVTYVDDVWSFPVSHYGPLIETHAMFPQRTNVEFAQVAHESAIKMRVWERGSGETLACGTGASAAAVVSALKGVTGPRVTVHLLGGDLFIEIGTNGRILMTGPAVQVFEGLIDIS